MSVFFILFILIQHIASCPLTDNYLSRCHCGILTNSESYIKCEEKSLNEVPIFKRSFPYDELILSNNNIKSLPRTSFDNIKTIRRINLENNSISTIDNDLLRLLGNYLEELTITGDQKINSLEFLTRYPLKNLRILKLNNFNLSEINLGNVFINMTKLEIVHLRSCQLKDIPNLVNVQQLDLEHNEISSRIILSTSYIYLNLAHNFISTIILEKNPLLTKLNVRDNHLKDFYVNSLLNANLQDINLSSNYLTAFNFSSLNNNINIKNINLNLNYLLSINFNHLPKHLLSLTVNNNLIKQMKFPNHNLSLSYLDLSYNQIRSIEKNLLFENLNSLNLEQNPLDCNCHLEWLKLLTLNQKKFNTTSWTCQSKNFTFPFEFSNFQCLPSANVRIEIFNISFVKISSQYGLYIQWSIIDDQNTLDYIQISISEPYYLSPKMLPNQTQIFLSNHIESHKKYRVCLILSHAYVRNEHCRVYLTDKMTILPSNEIMLERKQMNSIETKDFYDMNIFIMLVGSCIGGLVTIILILICFYLCIQIRKYHMKKNNIKTISYYSKNSNLNYPIYHTHSVACPYHHDIISNSTDSSQIDTSLSATNLKHIYQTIDNHDYASLKRENQMFDLWNQSLRQKR